MFCKFMQPRRFQGCDLREFSESQDKVVKQKRDALNGISRRMKQLQNTDGSLVDQYKQKGEVKVTERTHVRSETVTLRFDPDTKESQEYSRTSSDSSPWGDTCDTEEKFTVDDQGREHYYHHSVSNVGIWQHEIVVDRANNLVVFSA